MSISTLSPQPWYSINFKKVNVKVPYVSIIILIIYISLLIVYYTTPNTLSPEEFDFYYDNFNLNKSYMTNIQNKDYVLYARLLMNGNGWIIPLMNNMGIFKFDHNDIGQRAPTIIVYLLIHPLIEIYLGHVILLFVYFIMFAVGNVYGDRTSLTANTNNCNKDSKITEPMTCCGSHYYSKVWGFIAALWLYSANTKLTKYLAIIFLMVVWASQIYLDKSNNGVTKDSCFQLDWHASWVLQGFMFLGVLIIISNPNKTSTWILQVMVTGVFLYYMLLIFGIYKFVDEDFDINIIVIPTLAIGIILSWFLVYKTQKFTIDIYNPVRNN